MRISDWSSDVCSSDLATAIGAAVHSALTSAFNSVQADCKHFSCVRYDSGPSNKLIFSVPLSGTLRRVSAELHYCGPRGGTSKAKHQFAETDIEAEPELPSFHTEAPQARSEEHTSELPSLMHHSYAVFCL